MAQAVADVYNTHMEEVSKHLPRLLEMEAFASQKIKRATKKHGVVQTGSGNDFRAPFQYQAAGVHFGAANLAGGALSAGDGSKYAQFVQTAFGMQEGTSLNYDVMKEGKSKNALVDHLKKNLKEMSEAWKKNEDKGWHNITGTQGLIAYATANTTTVYTLDPEFGANLLDVGQPVEVYDTSLGSHRTSGGTIKITAINKLGPTVTLASDPSGAATDKLAIMGTGTTPAWMLGLYAVNNVATTGTLHGVNRETYPEIISNMIDGSSGLSLELANIMLANIEQRRGKKKKLIGFAHPAQFNNIKMLGVEISNWNRGSSDKMIDIMPKMEESTVFCGLTLHKDLHASKERIDLVNIDDWARVVTVEPHFYERPDNGGKLWEVRSSDEVTMAFNIYMVADYNFACLDPGAGGGLYDIPYTSGF